MPTGYKTTHEDFIKRANLIHNNEYEYLESYVKGKQPLLIKHKKCEFVFKQKPDKHLGGNGCPKCANIIKSKNIHNNAKIFCDYETGFYINKRILNAYQRKAKERNLIFEINSQDIFSIFKQQNGLCKITGAKLICDSINCKNLNWSIDRIDNDKGYTVDNIILVTKQVNIYRNRSSIKEFMEVCNMVSSNYNLIEKYKNMSPEEKAERLKNHSICYIKKKNEQEKVSVEIE